MRVSILCSVFAFSLLIAGCGSEEKSGPKEGLEEGNRLPDLDYEDMDGDESSIKAHRGNPLFITIGTGWCPPCQAETPGFQDVYEDFEDDGLVIIQALFQDDQGENPGSTFMETWRDTYGITFTLVADTSDDFWEALVPPSNDGYIPHNIVLDQDGVIVYSDYGSMSEGKLRNKVEDLLK